MIFGLPPFETDYDWLVDTVREQNRQPAVSLRRKSFITRYRSKTEREDALEQHGYYRGSEQSTHTVNAA